MIREERKSNIELLRLVLMLMIVIIHFLGHNYLSAAEPAKIDSQHFFTANLLFSFIVCAVDCFVLISGWFSIKFNVTKLFMFLLPICFYQLLMSCIYLPYGSNLSINPFRYWFVPPYVALMVISPLLNKGLNTVSKKNLTIILAVLTVFFILPIKSPSGMYGKNAFIFVYIYCLGFYLRNHFDNKHSAMKYFAMFLLSVAMIFVETIVLAKMGHYEGTRTLSYSYDNVFIISAAVFMFLTFSKLNFKSKVVNYLSASAFFVYIITENENCYCNETHSIYKILDVPSWEMSDNFIIRILAASVLLFAVALVVDIVRRLIFSKPEQLIKQKLTALEQRYLSDGDIQTA